ncbi:hypothetical protein BTO30_01035 [Domibacillus antri]|uniref:Motility accessory factor n=1 Tax=Domibacillus antri TaxID=1714264 RepID=A0A1Q8Q9L3_9BACI|nr:6-hydroxymethylpterin diphosphokinase MptE-like protein [Domibacillus antri]OLN24033.1 hypothetical protein BTO30_01035 [Domibacillus antri]
MMLIDNRNYLRVHQRPLLEQLAKWESEEKEMVEIEPSRKGVPTAKMIIDGKPQYIHSKYDPEAEAEKLIGQLENIGSYNHILFIGAGLGYHIQALLSQHPEMSYSIYEPNMEMLYHFLSHQNIGHFPKATLRTIITTANESELKQEVEQLHQTLDTKTFVFTLPACAKQYEKEQKIMMESVKELLKGKRSNLATSFSFQKRWTINSIKNFPEVLQTPNILHDIDKEAFKGKPAIIAAAGPSLSEEFENLRYIKENGLAYIFSVGSAINALIAHDIYPDAICTYDPQSHNVKVIEVIQKLNIKEIPLVFGSSVGYETLEGYPGSKLHMITNQDTVSPYYLKGTGEINIVLDAPTIAVITFQLLKMLGCGPIILAGQNLSYKSNERYAKGIQYENLSNQLTANEINNLVSIPGVDGQHVQANEGFINMRRQLEMYISLFSDLEVINTTSGGAHIEGTSFMPMSELIEKRLQEPHIVQPNWYIGENSYNLKGVDHQKKQMRLHKKRLNEAIDDAVKELRKIDTAVKTNRTAHLEKNFTRFDKEFNTVSNNPFFKVFIEPMVRVHIERLKEESQAIRFEKNLHKKGEKIAHLFAGFLMDCKGHIQAVSPIVSELDKEIEALAEQQING